MNTNNKRSIFGVLTIDTLGIIMYVLAAKNTDIVFYGHIIYLTYIVLTLYSYVLGPADSIVVGVVGAFISSFNMNSITSMPGLMASNFVICLNIGIWFLAYRYCMISKLKLHQHMATVLMIIVTNATGILLIQSIIDAIAYSDTFINMLISNKPQFVDSVITIVLSIPFAIFASILAIRSNTDS